MKLKSSRLKSFCLTLFFNFFDCFSSSTFARQQNNCDSKPCVFSIVLDFLMKKIIDTSMLILKFFIAFIFDVFCCLIFYVCEKIVFVFILFLNLKSWRLKCFIFDFIFDFKFEAETFYF